MEYISNKIKYIWLLLLLCLLYLVSFCYKIYVFLFLYRYILFSLFCIFRKCKFYVSNKKKALVPTRYFAHSNINAYCIPSRRAIQECSVFDYFFYIIFFMLFSPIFCFVFVHVEGVKKFYNSFILCERNCCLRATISLNSWISCQRSWHTWKREREGEPNNTTSTYG